jgi:nicotinate-nucleotide adenylyltransferase
LADRVVVVPVYQHALGKELSPFDVRLEMCRGAFASDPRVEVTDVERSLPLPSYTLVTLRKLREQYPNESLRLIVGTDVLPELSHWHRFDEVEELAPLLVLDRAGVKSANAPLAILPEVSSSEARTWFRADVSVDVRKKRERLIPLPVRRVIEQRRLYQA